MHCVYNVSIPSGKALKFSFTTFSLELESKCRYDYLRIVDDNRRLGTYCGSELSGKVVLVNGNYASITFHSDGSVQFLGFQLTISFIDNQNEEQRVLKSIAYISVSCGSVVNNTLKSPAYSDGFYPANMSCVYNTWIPYGKAMRLKFQSFDLASDSECRIDYLKITNGITERTSILR
ncbi:unnamed protein product [Porites evermanni]|uniref:CUB domain-containing protein n=1 Tax=Porites evermanni TaxID=104178 RepID=A0ABN8SF94_9CNID|nr:unnamed protein product [Porites evermanni]